MQFLFRATRTATAFAMLLTGLAQTTSAAGNPAISVLGDLRAKWSNESDTEADLHELEIGVVGPLNPYARAEVYLAIHDGESIEVEEARIHLDRYLPAGLSLMLGRSLIDVGRLNRTHPHAYPFVDRPLMHERFFGSDGAVDVGARLEWLAPLDAIATTASVGVVRGDVFLGGHEHDADVEADDAADATGPHAEEEPEFGVTGRVELFLEASADLSVALGGSFLTGEIEPDAGTRAVWFGPDLVMKLDLGPTRRLVVNVEALFASIDDMETSLERVGVHRSSGMRGDPGGVFAAADLRTSKRWNLGMFGESATGRLHDADRTTRVGAFVGLSLMEETTVFRLLARHTDPDAGDGENELVFQALFGLGPHSPHRY